MKALKQRTGKAQPPHLQAMAKDLSLAAVQGRFQSAILEGDDGILAELKDGPMEKRDVLLGVYRNAYVLRLIDILGASYEKLRAYTGEHFDDLARAYIAANPSRHPNGRWFGAKLPEFLAAAEPYCEHPVLADLASLERALDDVFDEADAPVFCLENLSGFGGEDWPHLVFVPHPATRRIDHLTNAAAIWGAIAADEEVPEAESLNEPLRLIIYRSDVISGHRPLSYEEAMMWDEAGAGVPFSILCELVATHGGEDGAPARAASYLGGWINQGLLTAVRSQKAGPNAAQGTSSA